MNRRSHSRSESRHHVRHRSRSPHGSRARLDSPEQKLRYENRNFSKHHNKNASEPQRYSDHHKSANVYENRYQDRTVADYDRGYRKSSPKRVDQDYEADEQKLSSGPRAERSVKQYFCGPEGTVVDFDELRKITVEIRRTLPRGAVPVPASMVKRKYDPSDVVIPRRPGEGSKPIFEREELRPKVIEERFIKIESTEPLDRYSERRPGAVTDRQEMRREDEDDLRTRLEERRMGSSSPQYALRPEWEPGFIKANYYEHDNRGHNPRAKHHRGGRGGRGFHDAGSFRGHRGRRGNNFPGSRSPPTWKHDMYDSMDEKPTSTTKA